LYETALARFSTAVIDDGGRMDVVYPVLQIVVTRVAGFTFG
jgi:hypothetical protein